MSRKCHKPNRTDMKVIKKLGKFTLLVAGILFLGLFVYANWNPPRLSDQVSDIDIKVLKFSRAIDSVEAKNMELELEKVEGITAASINAKSQLATFTFYPTKISAAKVESWLNDQNMEASATELTPAKAGCPVHAYLGTLDKIRVALCVRKS